MDGVQLSREDAEAVRESALRFDRADQELRAWTPESGQSVEEVATRYVREGRAHSELVHRVGRALEAEELERSRG
jgi:hypothetical protein